MDHGNIDMGRVRVRGPWQLSRRFYWCALRHPKFPTQVPTSGVWRSVEWRAIWNPWARQEEPHGPNRAKQQLPRPAAGFEHAPVQCCFGSGRRQLRRIRTNNSPACLVS